MANPRANGMLFFNEPFYMGMHPFAALSTHYIDADKLYQRAFGELIVVDRHSQPSSPHVGFDRLADLRQIFHREYIDGPRSGDRDLHQLAQLLDDVFVENTRVLDAAWAHHEERASTERPFDYEAPTLTKYGRLTHETAGMPRIEVSFALLHYGKAIREFNDNLAARRAGDLDTAFFYGVYCVVAVAACVEAIGNRLVFLQTGAHPDYRDRRQSLQKINDATAALAGARGRSFIPRRG